MRAESPTYLHSTIAYRRKNPKPASVNFLRFLRFFAAKSVSPPGRFCSRCFEPAMHGFWPGKAAGDGHFSWVGSPSRKTSK
jgi:hypothetical protein